MKHIKSALVAATTLAAVGTGVAVLTPSAQAGGEGTRQRASSCVGSWEALVTIAPSQPQVRVLVSFIADGNVILSEQGAVGSNVPGGADVEFNSTGHGAWTRDSGAGCSFVAKVYSSDVDGRDTGGAVVRATLRVDRRTPSALSGTGTFATWLPEGGGNGPIPISVTGTRIEV